MNLIKNTMILVTLLSSKSLFASVMMFECNYEYISGENFAATFVGNMQSENDTILALTNNKAPYSGAPLIFLNSLSSDIATVSDGSSFYLASVTSRENQAGFELTAAGRDVVQNGEISDAGFENERYSGVRWLVSFLPKDVPEPNVFLLMLFGLLALYTNESNNEGA
jgi:hypothetical protein